MNAFTDRRSMLRGALTTGAASTAAAIPAKPVLALLEAHKAAWELHGT